MPRGQLYEPLVVEEPLDARDGLKAGEYDTLTGEHLSYLVAARRPFQSADAAGRLCRGARDYGCCAPPYLRALVVDAGVRVPRRSLVGILGASGAGKSTLLACLSGRVSGGVLCGCVALDGCAVPPRSAAFRRSVAYVEQGDADAHAAELTCRETLAIACALRRPTEAPLLRARRIAAVAADLGLDGHLDCGVGSALDKGLSGGQLRRLSIGCECLGPAGHLLVDEPTSGLDSAAAAALLRALRDLADGGRGARQRWNQSPVDGRPAISSNPSTSLRSNSFSMIVEPLILASRVLDDCKKIIWEIRSKSTRVEGIF